MAATNFTPISLYYSATASATPSAGNLVAGELAINTNDGKLFYKDSSGVVQTLASKATTSGTFTSITDSGLTSGRVTYATTGGLLTDSSSFAYNGSSLNVAIPLSPWDTYNAIQVQNMSFASFSNGDNRIVGNAYYQSPNWKYQNTAPAVYQSVEAASGFFSWNRASSGTAGTNITWTEIMRTDTSGNLLVNTTLPYGKITSVNGASQYCYGTSATNQSGIYYHHNFTEAGTQRGSISSNGTLTSYNTTSDERLKENIVDAGSGLEKLANIKIRGFDWKENKIHQDFGVIAQELVTVAPEAVLQGDDNATIKQNWQVDTSVLVPAMIKAIQEQQALIESLTTRLTALESK
jgi:hypothetical protein